MIRRSAKEKMHARNRFRAGYVFERLRTTSPSLARLLVLNPHGDLSIDFGNPSAVKALNQALLKDAYGIEHWDLPPGYLCPPIPGRSDYLHHLADLLAGGPGSEIPRGSSVFVLDIGVGASCIYPLIGAKEYGWRFVGSEVDERALDCARRVVSSNAGMSDLIECRRQPSSIECFSGVLQPGEFFDVSMCNPPFHASSEDAAAANTRKRRNLGASKSGNLLNFGGQAGELWCRGGELGFVRRMISQSVKVFDRVSWFTTLVSKGSHLHSLHQALEEVQAATVKTIEMGQGQKQSRILAWTFMSGRASRRAR